MARLDEEHFSPVAVITPDSNAVNSIIRLVCIVGKHINSCRYTSKHVHIKDIIVLVIL